MLLRENFTLEDRVEAGDLPARASPPACSPNGRCGGDAWNNRCTLSCILSARALIETFAVLAGFERQVARRLKEENLGGLDALAQNGIFASRDPEWIKENPETQAVSVLTYVDKYNKRARSISWPLRYVVRALSSELAWS